MGAKATKFEGSYLPDTPTMNKLRLANGGGDQEVNSTPARENNAHYIEPKDPRSPSGCRTPLAFLQPQTQPQMQAANGGGAFVQLRKRILKGLSLNDPRSPQLNRTPLVFDEAIDRTLNMDDTFADLFEDTRAPKATAEAAKCPSPDIELKDLSAGSFGTPLTHNNSSLEIVSLAFDEETMPCNALLPQTPMLPQDPRSPSIGVDRTPIIFCDDDEDEAREAQMLEQILETLTLNLSNGESSIASFASAASELTLDEPPQPSYPANKHLERVRLGNKKRVPPRKPARSSKSTPQRIYVDAEAGTGALTSTPKSTPGQAAISSTKRTPLSCVKNRTHLRSRSLEKTMRKTRMPLQSFDDQLNPSTNVNVPSLHLLMTGEDSFDASIY